MATAALLLLALALLVGWPLLVLRWLAAAWPLPPQQGAAQAEWGGLKGATPLARLSLPAPAATLHGPGAPAGGRLPWMGEGPMQLPCASDTDRALMLAILRTYARDYRRGHSRPPMAEARLRELVGFAERLLRAQEAAEPDAPGGPEARGAAQVAYVSWPTDTEVDLASSNPGQLMIWSYFLPTPVNEDQRRILCRITYRLSPAIRAMARQRTVRALSPAEPSVSAS